MFCCFCGVHGWSTWVESWSWYSLLLTLYLRYTVTVCIRCGFRCTCKMRSNETSCGKRCLLQPSHTSAGATWTILSNADIHAIYSLNAWQGQARDPVCAEPCCSGRYFSLHRAAAVHRFDSLIGLQKHEYSLYIGFRVRNGKSYCT